MTYYLKVDDEGIIRDAIEFPYKDYVKVELSHIPEGLYGGWWKLEGGEVVEYPSLKPMTSDNMLEERVAELEDIVLLLTM